jgi:hypothetical protein
LVLHLSATQDFWKIFFFYHWFFLFLKGPPLPYRFINQYFFFFLCLLFFLFFQRFFRFLQGALPKES